MKPADVRVEPWGVVVDAFGKSEVEAAAALIIRYHVAKGLEDWTDFTRRQIGDFLLEDDVARKWAQNPIWRPYPYGLVERGLVEGWETADAPGRFTEKALHHLEHRGTWSSK